MRRFILVGLVVAAAATLPAGGAARTTSTTISISVQTSNRPIGHLVWATYGKTAVISGSTADGQAGEPLILEESVFPFGAGFIKAARATTGVGGSYSFTTKPTLATRYYVALAEDSTSLSPVATVYVAANWINLPTKTCSGFSCHKHFGNKIIYPAAVAKREGRKRAYFYFGVRYGSQTTPPSRVHFVKTGRLHRHGRTYRTGFSVTFSTVRAYYYYWLICTKDTESRDGLGLPGHHHCGGRSIRYSAIQQGYIG
jgi:hypothetical protein